jgi:hypothetical protein
MRDIQLLGLRVQIVTIFRSPELEPIILHVNRAIPCQNNLCVPIVQDRVGTGICRNTRDNRVDVRRSPLLEDDLIHGTVGTAPADRAVDPLSGPDSLPDAALLDLHSRQEAFNQKPCPLVIWFIGDAFPAG